MVLMWYFVVVTDAQTGLPVNGALVTVEGVGSTYTSIGPEGWYPEGGCAAFQVQHTVWMESLTTVEKDGYYVHQKICLVCGGCLCSVAMEPLVAPPVEVEANVSINIDSFPAEIAYADIGLYVDGGFFYGECWGEGCVHPPVSAPAEIGYSYRFQPLEGVHVYRAKVYVRNAAGDEIEVWSDEVKA